MCKNIYPGVKFLCVCVSDQSCPMLETKEKTLCTADSINQYNAMKDNSAVYQKFKINL